MPSNTREFCSEAGNDHAIVSNLIELRDSIGFLAVHMLAARENFATMSEKQALSELFNIIVELHEQYEDLRIRHPDAV